MVNVLADNIKLKGRARRIVMAVTGVDEEDAAGALEAAGGNVKMAILLAAGAEDVAGAERLLGESGGKVRGALAGLRR
jgi:N-acetylmuramic acid 6-phosphate etherase